MTTWAITGSSGYVATALSQHLQQKGDRLRLLVHERQPQVDNPDIFQGDVRNSVVVQDLLAGTDATVHLAGWVHKRTMSESQKRECWEVNIEGTRCVVRELAAVAPQSFLVYVSTANVYPA